MNPLFSLNWRKLIYDFNDADQKVIPRVQRLELIDYITKGEKPSGFLLGILTKDFALTFGSAKSSLEKRRMQTILDFCEKHLPRSLYGSHEAVDAYVNLHAQGVIAKAQQKYTELKDAKGQARSYYVD